MSEMEIVLALNELDMYPATSELTADDIKRKWKLLIRYYHPDTNDTAAFHDGEKAKKVNHAKDFLLDNLNTVNAYIRKVNNIKTEEEILKEKQEEERRAQQEYQRAQEELKRKQQEEYQKAQQEYQKAQQQTSQQNYTYSYDVKPNRSRGIYLQESIFNLVFKFTEMLIAIACVIIVGKSDIGFVGIEEGNSLFLYTAVFALPIVILTLIPGTRRKIFTYFVNTFLLFCCVVMTLGVIMG